MVGYGLGLDQDLTGEASCIVSGADGLAHVGLLCAAARPELHMDDPKPITELPTRHPRSSPACTSCCRWWRWSGNLMVEALPAVGLLGATFMMFMIW